MRKESAFIFFAFLNDLQGFEPYVIKLSQVPYVVPNLSLLCIAEFIGMSPPDELMNCQLFNDSSNHLV